MHDSAFFGEIVLLFGAAVTGGALLRYIGVPSIIGFLLAGMIIGPSSTGMIDPHHVEPYAEVGLVLVLFMVGLELSPSILLQMGRQLIAAAGLQVLLVFLTAAGVLLAAGFRSGDALFVLGLAVTLSSTAIVLNLLRDRRETTTLAGVILTGVLIVQDILIIAVLLILPMLAPGEDDSLMTSFLREGLEIGALVMIIVVARPLLPRLINMLVKKGGAELSTLFAVLVAAAAAWLASLAGWSPGLGACIAGFILGESDRQHQLTAEIAPFRDVFNALFFISLGMIVNLDVLLERAGLLVVAIMATVVVKTILTTGAVRAAGWPLRIAIAAGIGLSSVSEFAYVLIAEAQSLGLLDAGVFDVTVAYVVGTMIAGALVFPLGPVIARWLESHMAPAPQAHVDLAGGHEDLSHHVVVVGYGLAGRNLATMLTSTKIPFVVVEVNAKFVEQARGAGARVIVGDATRMAILEHAGIANARALVVAINDPRANELIVGQVKHHYPNVFTVVRAATAEHIEDLKDAGADLVIPADFETSIEIAAHVLKHFRLPANVIDAQIASVRAGGYGLLRGRPADRAMMTDLLKVLEETATETHYVNEGTTANGQTIAQLNLRARAGASIIAVVRDGKATTNPPPDYQLKAGDVLVLVGAHQQLINARSVLESPASSPS